MSSRQSSLSNLSSQSNQSSLSNLKEVNTFDGVHLFQIICGFLLQKGAFQVSFQLCGAAGAYQNRCHPFLLQYPF